MQNQSNAVTPGGEITVREALAVLGEQKLFMTVFCVSAIVTALAATYIASEKYDAATTIVYRPEEVTRLKAQESVAFGAPTPQIPFDLISANLGELAKGELLLRSVVQELHLDVDPEPNDNPPWYVDWYRKTKKWALNFADDAWDVLKYGRTIDDDPVAGATRKLRDNVTLKDNKAYVFYLVVRDKYPLRAPLIVDAIAKRLVAYLNDEQQQAGRERAAQLGDLVTKKQQEISGYEGEIQRLMLENHVVSTSVEAEKLVEEWSNLEQQRIVLESEIESGTRRLADTEKYYAGKQRALQSEGSGPSGGGLGYIQPADFKKLGSDRLFTEIELNASKAKHAALVSSIAAVKARRTALPELSRRLDYLDGLLTNAKRDFAQLSDAYQEANVRVAQSQSEAKVLHAAVVPPYPVQPIKIYNVGLAAFLSLFIAMGLVYLLTFAELELLFVLPRHRLQSRDGLAMAAAGGATLAAEESPERRRSDRRVTSIVPWLGVERRKG